MGYSGGPAAAIPAIGPTIPATAIPPAAAAATAGVVVVMQL